MKRQIKKVPIKSMQKLFKINISNFFMRSILPVSYTHLTINRFRNRVKKEINEVFTQTVLLLSSKGFIKIGRASCRERV